MSLRINVTLNDELENKLYAIATERNVGLAQILRQLINDYQLHEKEENNEQSNTKSNP